MSKAPPNSWSESLSNAQVLLEARIAREGGKGTDLGMALVFLARARLLMLNELARATSGPAKRPGRTGARISDYRVESFRGEEVLTEYRGPHTEPFRSPREVYDSIVKHAAAQSRPFDFMDLFDSVRKSLGDLPDYRVRVCTRFMVAAGVLDHNRRRFSPAKAAKSFTRLAQDAWDSAARKPFIPDRR